MTDQSLEYNSWIQSNEDNLTQIGKTPWWVYKNHNILCLLHSHGDHTIWFAGRQAGCGWRCLNCITRAPQEVEDVASLVCTRNPIE